MGVAGTLPVQSFSLPRLMTLPCAVGSISNTIRPGVADAFSFCPRGTPAARRRSRGRTIRLEPSSCTIVVTPKVWRGCGVAASSAKCEGIRRQIIAEWRHHFRPEFLNRVDDTVLFKPLTLADIKKIVELQLTLLRARLSDRHITLDLSDAAKEHLAREGYDPVYGARPLKRFLQRALETPLSRQLISGEVTDHSRVTVEFKKGELVFEAKAAKK